MLDTAANLTGMILHLQRLSTEDGPGIRTSVFFKGCPLSCQWCHNPESITARAQIQWLENRCIGCDSCIQACPKHGLARLPGGIARDRTACTVCGECAKACPSGAMEILGARIDAAALTKELLKDRAYFAKSGGGVTLTGGEPTLQADFASALCDRLAQAGVPVALDTCGLCAPSTLERLIDRLDTILFDLKFIDPDQHKQWTGATNPLILKNLLHVRERVENAPDKVLWVRTPLIPGATFTQENLHGIGEFLQHNMEDTVQRWELCAFNNLCRDKYSRLGIEWPFAATPMLRRDDLAQAGEWARESGFDPQKIHVSGATRVES